MPSLLHCPQDFHLELCGGPTEAQLLETRLAAFQASEADRLSLIAAEEARLWLTVEVEAAVAAERARVEYR